MSRKWSRLLKIGLPALLVVGLVAGLTGTALAAPKKTTPNANANAAAKVIGGKVLSKTANSFVVQSGNHTQPTVLVDGDTKYFQVPRALPPRLPGILGKFFKENEQGQGRGPAERVLPNDLNALRKLGKRATFADLAVGDKVVVRLVPGQGLAKEVLIVKPLPPKEATVSGTIAVVSGTTAGTITVTKSDSTQIVLNWDSNTRFVLKGAISVLAGQKVTAIYNPTGPKAILVRVTTP